MKNCLLVDDEINLLHALQREIRQLAPELSVEIFTDPKKAFLRGGEVPFAIVISDYRMPEMNGATFLQAFKHVQPEAVRLMLSASSDFQTLFDAVNEGEIFRYIAKPWNSAELQEILSLALARHDELLAAKQLASTKNSGINAEIEALRLEQEEPGITKVNWGPDGSVHLD